jgi:hypothetical protein
VVSLPIPIGIWERVALVTGPVVRPLGSAQQHAVSVLRASLSALDQAPAARPGTAETATLRSKLDGLLGRALEQSTASSRQALYHRIVDRLVPDEARILSALSDGSVFALVHVYARGSGDALLENACLVGKLANVSLPQCTPLYVSHLRALGLVDVTPADAMLKDDYQILMADPAVLKAVKTGSRGPVPPRVERCTLRMSALGRELWAAAAS